MPGTITSDLAWAAHVASTFGNMPLPTLHTPFYDRYDELTHVIADKTPYLGTPRRMAEEALMVSGDNGFPDLEGDVDLPTLTEAKDWLDGTDWLTPDDFMEDVRTGLLLVWRYTGAFLNYYHRAEASDDEDLIDWCQDVYEDLPKMERAFMALTDLFEYQNPAHLARVYEFAKNLPLAAAMPGSGYE